MTSSLSSDAVGALLDELEKISEDARAKKAKRWLKNTAIVAAGTGMGTGAMMLAEKLTTTALSPHWRLLNPTVRNLLLGSAVGVTSTGAALLAAKLFDERGRNENE